MLTPQTRLLSRLRKLFTDVFSRSSRYRVKVFCASTALPPSKKRAEDAGFDFHVDLVDTYCSPVMCKVIQPGEVVKISTGCRLEFPKNTMWLWDVRSSMGLKGLDVCCRTIDSPYRGVLSIVIVNNSREPVEIHHHQRVAQLIPNPFSTKYWMQVVEKETDLAPSDRGDRGFGSSGH